MWKNIHQIANFMDHLLICIDQVLQYDEKTGRCEPLNVPTISFSPSSTPPVLKHFGTIGTYQKDWSLDFWFKFSYTSTLFSPFVILNQDPASCGTTSSIKHVVLRMSLLNGPSSLNFKLLTEDMLDLTRVKNENSNPIIQANTYFHVSLVNSGTADKLTTTLNFTISS